MKLIVASLVVAALVVPSAARALDLAVGEKGGCPAASSGSPAHCDDRPLIPVNMMEGAIEVPAGTPARPSLAVGTAETGLYSFLEEDLRGWSLGFTSHCPWNVQCHVPVVMTSEGEFVFGSRAAVNPNHADIETNSGPVYAASYGNVSAAVPIQMNQWSQVPATQPFISWRSRGHGPGAAGIVREGDVLGLWQSSGDDGSLPSVHPNAAAVNVMTAVDSLCDRPGPLNIPGEFMLQIHQSGHSPHGTRTVFKVRCNGDVDIPFGSLTMDEARHPVIDASRGGHFAGIANSGATFDTSYSINAARAEYKLTLSGRSTIDILTNGTGAGAKAGTIILPAAPQDGQVKVIACDVATMALTVDGNGHAVHNPPSSCAAGGGFRLIYAAGIWYRLGLAAGDASVDAGEARPTAHTAAADEPLIPSDPREAGAADAGLSALRQNLAEQVAELRRTFRNEKDRLERLEAAIGHLPPWQLASSLMPTDAMPNTPTRGF
jgi:hypothetical protein